MESTEGIQIPYGQMLNICVKCGIYRPDKVIDPAGPYAICPECGHKHRFLRLPLFLVSGASGTGKSTACHELLGKLADVVLLDSDILWRPEFAVPGAAGPNFIETWLRVAKSVGQSGRPVALFGAGVGVPDNIEPCVERLRSRPEWRQTHGNEYVEAQVRFNRWFKERPRDLTPTIDLQDTTSSSVADTARGIAAWIRTRLQ
jgi:hypothetical protein